jgi:NADPH-dependent glutamate synthase beta subunit-like oxidoreductase/Pyruvate/2-oxoacid:ferredoxin oxidoreductase delta subunit
METVSFFVNNTEAKAPPNSSVLEAARNAEIYIPSLCYHPDLPISRRLKSGNAVFRAGEQIVNDAFEKEFEGCNLCLVEVEGQTDLVPACDTKISQGMRIHTDTDRVREARQEKLMRILAKHPHACLTCAQKEGCTREPCSTNVPVSERCCSKFGNCELEKVAEYVGIRVDTSRFLPANLRVDRDEPLFIRDYNLCINCTRCVRACQELRGVKALAFVHHNGDAFVGSVKPSLKESDCKFCGACVEVCPTGALMDKNVKGGDREQNLVPCRYACPAHVDVPRYVNLITQGRYADATAVVREKVPFPSVLGHACARPCERMCRSREVNEAIAICALKRFAVDNTEDMSKTPVMKAQPTGKRVAIVGSGPSGLTAAYYLARKGHSVTVFEAMSKLGGMMSYGIQEYRLPESVLQRDLQRILHLGIDVKANTPINESQSIEQLKSQGYNAILVAVGLQKSRILNVEGANSPDVLGGLDLLRDVRLGKEVKVKEHVLVVGGGSVAVDVALTALRLGATYVDLICLEKPEEMPAFPWEIQQATEEGVNINNSWGVKQVLTDQNSKVKGIELVRCVSVFDENGRFNPSLDESTVKTMPADMIVFAIGQSSNLKGLSDAESLKFNRAGILEVNGSTLETSIAGVFACGDVVKGPGSIVDSVALGRKAAEAIEKYLGGNGNIDETLLPSEQPNQWLGREEGFASKHRAVLPSLAVDRRRGNFAEVALGFDEKTAISEASRCLRCDLRLQIRQPMLPPEKWMRFDAENVAKVPACEGVFQLLDNEKAVIYIKGAMNLQDELTEQITANKEAKYFLYDEAKMFTMRESELLQQFMKKHGKMPKQNIGLEEDLY